MKFLLKQIIMLFGHKEFCMHVNNCVTYVYGIALVNSARMSQTCMWNYQR